MYVYVCMCVASAMSEFVSRERIEKDRKIDK